MQNLIGHHTCINTKNSSEIITSGIPPAKAIYKPEETKNPFLGSGYYFWDYNIGQARYWGKTHYNQNYYIFEADIPYNDNMLDLVGNRQHLEWILNLMYDFKEENEDIAQWDLATFIEFLKNTAQELDNPSIFPFTSIRAVDHSATIPDVEYYFDAKSPNFIIMNPRIIICVISEDKNIIQNLRLKEKRNG